MKKIYSSVILLLIVFHINAQVKIGANPTTINTGSLLELEHKVASPKALTLPRMTNAEMLAIPTPTNGMFVYNITGNCVFQYRTNLGWSSLCTSVDPTLGAAADPAFPSAQRLWPYHSNDLTIGAVGNKKGIISLPGAGLIATGDYSHAEGLNDQATEPYSWAIMENNKTYGANSFSLGLNNTNYGSQSFLGGIGNFSDVGTTRITTFGRANQFNTANCRDAFSVGGGDNSHFRSNTISLGTANTMNAVYSYALGAFNYTDGTGNYLTAIGSNNFISGSHNFGGGLSDTVGGFRNFAYGYNNKVFGIENAVLGSENVLDGAYNFASGKNNVTSRFYNVMGGVGNTINGDASTAFGQNNRIQAGYSMAVGLADTLNFPLAYAFGSGNKVETIGMAVGQNNVVGPDGIGRPGFAFGGGNRMAAAPYGFALGVNNTMTNGASMLGMGEGNTLTGDRTFTLAGSGFNNIQNTGGASAWPTGTIGSYNKIQAEGAMIFGYNAQLTTRGSIGFADLSVAIPETAFPGAIDNSFNARYAGGYQLFTNAGQTTGAALASGATAWTALSDRTAKENIRNNSYGLKELMNLNTYTYNYTGNPTTKRNIGVMAQDVKLMMPELVENMSNGKLGVVSTEMIPVLIKAIQEQQAQINALKEEIKHLRK